MNADELSNVLKLHAAWLQNEPGGVRANLRGANLSSADLSSANLRGANLSSADLSSANLRGANLSSADLSSANLRGANLSSADLSSANLRGANLSSADLSSANLRGANLSSADLSSANLSSANLRGANLSSADLSSANLDYSCWPLWCGSNGVKIDRKIAAQLAAHLCAVDCDDPDYLAVREALLPFARTSHRAGDLGLLEEK